MVFLMAEEWYRQLVIEYYQLRGNVVLVDRHFVFDYYYHDIVRTRGYRPFSSRAHGYMLEHLYPRPDLVICLDAPAEVLYEPQRRRQRWRPSRSGARNICSSPTWWSTLWWWT